MAGLFMVKQTIDVGEFGNPMLNVYGFRSVLAVLDEMNELLNAFEAQILPKWAACVASASGTVLLEAYELSGTGYVSRPLTAPVVGLCSGAPLAPFVSWSFKLIRANLGERSGGKRIGMVAEDTVNYRSPVSGLVAEIDDFADAYGAPLKVGLIDTWFPVILERPAISGDPWSDHAANGAVFNTLSTQNTRKK